MLFPIGIQSFEEIRNGGYVYVDKTAQIYGLTANGTADAAAYAAMQDAAADVFWPQARTAAVRDAAIRKACLPYIEQLRPLYPHGTEVRTRRDWRLFRWMMQTFGPRFTLWAASLQRK